MKLHVRHRLGIAPQTSSLEQDIMVTQIKVYGISLLGREAGTATAAVCKAFALAGHD